MSEEPQSSRLDSLIGIFRAFLRIDPMMALIAILIIAPIALPIGSAILNGETEVVITFVVFIAAIVFAVYIPLIIVRTWVFKEKELTQERKDAVNKEMASRIEDKQHARERTDKVVDARVSNMEAQTKAIIDNIPHFERFLLHEEAKKIREALALDLKDEGGMNSRLGLVIESFESVNRKFDILEKIVPGLQATIEDIRDQFLEKPPESYHTEKIKQLLRTVEGMASMIAELNDKLLVKESNELVTSDPLRKFEQEETVSVFKEVDIPESMKASLAIHQTTKIQENGATQAEQEFFKEALDVVENMEDSEELEPYPPPLEVSLEAKPLNYWECHYCQNKNPLKAPRCKKCSKGKKLVD